MLPLGKQLLKTICKQSMPSSTSATSTLQSLKRALACSSLSNHYFYKNSLNNVYNGVEMLALADEKDQPVGKGLRNNNEWIQGYQRCASVLLATEKGEFLVQKRANSKAYCPGYWDLTFGGMVRFGESYIYSAHRELFEELGIQLNLKPLFKYLYQDEQQHSRTWCNVFLGILEGNNYKFQFTDNEVDEVVKMTIPQIEELIFQKEKITPDSLNAFKHFQNLNQSPY